MTLPEHTVAPPSLHRRKTVSWLVLFAGAGTLLLCAFEFLADGQQWWDAETLLLLGLGVAMTLIPAIVLRRSYRWEPANVAGFWQLSLVDLLIVSFFAALFMSLFRALWPSDFVRFGIAFTFLLSAGFTLALLVAARKGCKTLRVKIVCALGYLLGTSGLMLAGMFLFVLLFVGLVERSPKQMLEGMLELFTAQDRSSGDRVFFNLIRAGLLCIPIGYALKRWAETRIAPKISDEEKTA